MSNPFIEDIKNQYKNGSALIKLIIVNVAVFLGIKVIGLLLWLFAINNGGIFSNKMAYLTCRHYFIVIQTMDADYLYVPS